MTDAPPRADRASLLERLRSTPRFDLVVVGGGATGLGVALDAAARGFTVACLEREDFAKGTSSRATKLVHGGVRYLAQGHVPLVREALRERTTILANAPHLAQPLPFVVPGYRWWEPGFYGVGLKAYGALAGSRGLGPTELLGPARTRQLLPTVRSQGLAGGVLYWDAQFDDARLAVALARTALRHGAVVLNHAPVAGLKIDGGRVAGVMLRDAETGDAITLAAGCVVNATGVWVDAVRAMDRSGRATPRRPLVAPSQGTHLVVGREFLPGGHALMVPRTSDGRVLFGVPWQGRVLLGTTDTPCNDLPLEPEALRGDVDFILGEAGHYLDPAPTWDDVRSAWVGLRPLVRSGDNEESTKTLSREHTVIVGRSGLVTVTGGKWTTYRAMAEDVLAHCIDAGLLPLRDGGVTEKLRLVGAAPGRSLAEPPGEHLYGSEAEVLRSLPGARRWLWRDGEGGLSEAMVRFAVRHEMARTVEDVLARRSRLLFLDAREAMALARPVARLVADELGRAVPVAQVAEFVALAKRYFARP